MGDDREELQAALEGRYVLGHEVGAGGMGVVYAATDLKHDRDVALKILRSEHATGVHGQRFLDEIDISSSLVHPHIVPLFDSGHAGSRLYYVMPLLEGRSLRDALRPKKMLPPDRALDIAIDVCDAAAYAHSRGVVHRDIKPGNIMFSGKHALLADFGVARAFERARTQELTVSGAVVGTLEYMSPEQFSDGANVDGRSDIYSIGCVLYRMLSGRSPFGSSSAPVIAAGHLQRPPPSLLDARPEITPRLNEIVQRALAKAPEDRFQSAAEMGAALEEVRSDTAAATGTKWKLRPNKARRRRTVGVLATVIGGVAVAYVGFLGGARSPATADPPAASFLVLPYLDEAATPEAQALGRDLATEITRQLNGWDSVTALTQVSLERALRDMGIAPADFDLTVDGPRLAAQAGIGRLAAVTLDLRGDSAMAEVTLLDGGTGSAIGRPIQSAALRSDLGGLARPAVNTMIGFDAPPLEIDRLHRQSSSPIAVTAYIEGRRHLDVWDVTAAERAFRIAVAADEAFSMSHYFLGLTLYWRVAQNPSALADLGPEIARHSVRALETSEALSDRDVTHVSGFERFMRGDFPAARSAYEELVASDSTDAYAWLLLGTVEYRDRSLHVGAEGDLRPRGSWQSALEAFDTALRLSPSLYLGYGHLLDIGHRVTNLSGPLGFERPSDELLTMWEPSDPRNLVAFRPVYRDTIHWLDDQAFAALPEDELERGAQALVDYLFRSFRRGVDYLPNEARPHEVLGQWALVQRGRLEVPADPASIERLTVEAMQSFSRAMSLKADTLPADLFRLANLYVALDSTRIAIDLHAQGMTRAAATGSRVDHIAANVPFVTGRPLEGLDVLRSQIPRSRGIPVSETGELVMYSDEAVAIVDQLRAAAAAGWDSVRLAPMLELLDARWAEPDFTRAEIDALRADASGRLVLPLVTSSLYRTTWASDLAPDHPVWRVLGTTTPGRELSPPELARLIGELHTGSAESAFVLGEALLAEGFAEEAERTLARLDSIPYDVDAFDLRWALWSRAQLIRARANESLGANSEAIRHYESLVGRWPNPDSTVSHVAIEARSASERLRRR